MSSFIDIKYINLISPQLQKFKWKTTVLANCRCPSCGDSSKNKNKARGYFFKKKNDFFFKCHNCGVGFNLYNFLEMMSPTLCKQYSVERYINGENGNSNYKKPSLVDLYPNKATELKTYSYVGIDTLPESHDCVKYLISRGLGKDKWKHFRYTENFYILGKEINEKYNLFKEPRLIIPIYDRNSKVIGVQGRTLSSPTSVGKYITLRVDDTPMCYGMDKIKTNEDILLVEGPIDSLFLPNSLACLGSTNFIDFEEKFSLKNITHIVDNEPRNKAIVSVVEQLIKSNKKICIWSEENKFKDINEMVLNGIDVCGTIRSNTYQGLSSMVHFNKWRKYK